MNEREAGAKLTFAQCWFVHQIDSSMHLGAVSFLTATSTTKSALLECSPGTICRTLTDISAGVTQVMKSIDTQFQPNHSLQDHHPYLSLVPDKLPHSQEAIFTKRESQSATHGSQIRTGDLLQYSQGVIRQRYALYGMYGEDTLALSLCLKQMSASFQMMPSSTSMSCTSLPLLLTFSDQ